ncbi:nuclear transport factor 2 family protein [Providencia rettgeri]|uniref:nuclear transport factor 2 family protein n=1 Tax=Providencia rettgeri TaxID=587 RepID=UPI002362D371|nr:nuclear transport factor 2 family protein [Providencia rettgeri]
METLFNTLIELEKKLYFSANRQNIDFLQNILHPDFFEFSRSGGTTDKPDTLASLIDETPKTIYSDGYHCTLLSESTVLMTYMSFELHQGEKTRQTNRSSIWLKNSANQWQLRFHQGTQT